MSDLRTKTYRGAFWSAIDALGARFVQFVVGIVLARLLLPEQFGLIGMLAIFMAITQSLLNSGFGSALIQKQELTDADTSSVFYFNIVVSLVLAGILWLAAPWIAAFYSQPILTALTRALSLVIVIDAFSVVQRAVLTRNLDFKTQTRVSLAAGVGSGAIGIVMAYNGFGVWSLAVQQVSAALFRALLLWLFNTWRPRLLFSVQSLQQMFRFGSRLLVSSLLNQAFRNVHYVVIGRLFAPAALGFYTRARQMEQLPAMTLSSIVSRVAFPTFSALQADDARLKRALQKALAVLVFFNAPVMIGLAVAAEPLVLVLLTERWLPSVPYLQLLCIAGLISPLHVLNLNVLMAKGRSDLFLRLEVLKKALALISIAILWRWGIAALIIGQIVTSLLSFLLNSYYTGKFLGYGALMQIRDVGVYLLLALIMGVGVYSLTALPISGDLLLLLAQIGSGIAIYLLFCLLFQPPAFVEIWTLLRARIAERKYANQSA